MQAPLHDIVLLEKLKAGDIASFEKLYVAYRKLLMAIAMMILQSEEEAKDAVQEFFTDCWQRKLFTHLNATTPEELKNFLSVSIKNRCLNKIKSDNKRLKRYENFLVNEFESSPEKSIVNAELNQHLRDAIARLSEQQAVVFTKGYIECKKRSEIAEELSISEQTVKTQMARALHHLRKLLKNAVGL